MSIKIQGKPLEEWVAEQKKKDGVMIVHRGTTRNGYSTSTYNGAIVTLMDDKDVRYENADISLRINGKEYRLTGNLVERKSGIWYVDGSIVDLPEQEQKANMADDIAEIKENATEKVDDAVNSFLEEFGITNINCYTSGCRKQKSSSSSFKIKNDYTGGETIIHGQAPGRLPQGNALSSRVVLSTSDVVTGPIPSRGTPSKRSMVIGMLMEKPSIGTPSGANMWKAMSLASR